MLSQIMEFLTRQLHMEFQIEFPNKNLSLIPVKRKINLLEYITKKLDEDLYRYKTIANLNNLTIHK